MKSDAADGLPSVADYVSAYRDLWNQAPDEIRREGERWYADAGDEVSIPGVSRDRSAAVAAHLSPRISWDQCVRATVAMLTGRERPSWIMTGPWKRAMVAYTSDDSLATFGKSAVKTEPFARALAGDPSAIVVDTHMIHAGFPFRLTYNALSTSESRRCADRAREALRALSEELGVPGAVLQATIWLCWKPSRGAMTAHVRPVN